MKEELRIDIVGLAGACSYALDCIEAELVKIKNKHGKRVAYISVCMAEYLAIQGDALQDLAMCALLHDNALTQYITEELERNYVIDIKKDLSVRKTNLHCIYGEKNITKLPFKTDVSNVILYHHEHADGTGPFQKKWNETPNANTRFKDVPEWVTTTACAIANGLPLILMIIVQYSSIVTKGIVPYPAMTAGGINAFCIAPCAIFSAVSGRYIYKKTGNVWAAGTINAIIFCLMMTYAAWWTNDLTFF